MRTSIIKISQYISIVFLLTASTSCSKLIDVGQPNNIVTSNKVFNNKADVQLALNGLYTQWNAQISYFNPICGISADELNYFGNVAYFMEYSSNNVSSTNRYLSSLWDYSGIFRANAIIENVSIKPDISEPLVKIAVGTAKFTRAFNYFYLVNMFGNVPLVLSTNYSQTATLPRADIDTVYKQIVSDLKDAINLLPDSYDSRGKGIINAWAAKALLARVYLYQKDWNDAKTLSSQVIQSGIFHLETDLKKVFLINSSEAIWQLATLNGNGGIDDPRLFIPASGIIPTYSISDFLYKSFETGDKRKDQWIATSSVNGTEYFYPYKYVNNATGGTSTEYLMVLRYAEQFLIRAEAEAELNNNKDALNDIDSLRRRAGLSLLSIDNVTRNKDDILRLIEQERNHEFFCEYGHRWFDLKRTGRVDAVLGIEKQGWKNTAQLFPVPFSEIQRNPNLIQNPGYK